MTGMDRKDMVKLGAHFSAGQEWAQRSVRGQQWRMGNRRMHEERLQEVVT